MPEEITESAPSTSVGESAPTDVTAPVTPTQGGQEVAVSTGESSAPVAPAQAESAANLSVSEGSEGSSGQFESAFEGYSPEEQAGLLNLVATIRDNPASAAEMLQNLAQALVSEESDERGGGTAVPDQQEVAAPVDARAQFEQWAAERDEKIAAQAAQKEAVASLDSRIDELGYGRGSAEAPAIDRAALLMLAHDTFGGDIDKAHEAVQAWKQSVVDAALAPAKAAKAQFAPVERNLGNGAEPGKKSPKTFAEAQESLRQRLS